MPLALEPNAMFEAVLKCDRKKPDGARPTFICRYLSCREWREIADIMDSLEKVEGGGPAVLDVIIEQVKRCVVGWRDMARPGETTRIPFDLEHIEDVIGMTDAQDLLQMALAGRPDTTDVKNSPSPLGSKPAKSAKRAPARRRVRK